MKEGYQTIQRILGQTRIGFLLFSDVLDRLRDDVVKYSKEHIRVPNGKFQREHNITYTEESMEHLIWALGLICM